MGINHRQFSSSYRVWAMWGVCWLVLSGCSGCNSEFPVPLPVPLEGIEVNQRTAVTNVDETQDETQDEAKQEKAKKQEPEWEGKPESLIASDSLKGWEAIEYGGEGQCRVEGGVLVIESGDPMTGVSLTRDNLPKTNYEISLKARRVEGIDMFCGLTFPVDDSHCSLIVGGWAGATVGLSCIDDLDASSNDTSKIMRLKPDQWYQIRVRILPEKIVVWIDDQEVISQDLKGHKVSLRAETVPCKPFGLCTFQTTAEIKDLQIRRIKAATSKAK